MKAKWLFFLLPLSLYAADAKFGGTAEERHAELAEHFSGTTEADHEKEPFNKRKFMLDDWGGVRSYLAERGITVGAAYTFDSLQNPFGGLSQGYNYAGSFGIDANVDLSRYLKVCGLEFYTSVVYRSGTSLSERRIGNQFPVAQVFGGENLRLNEIYLRETLLDGKVVFKLGQLDQGNDFIQSPLYYHYVNNAFDGNPIAVFFNFPSYTAYPNSTWGAYAEFLIFEVIKTKWAIFNANSELKENRFHGLNFTFASTEGVQLTTEWEYLYNQRPQSQGLPGNYQIGFTYFTRPSEALPVDKGSNNYGWYIHCDQKLYHREGADPKQGFTPWIALFFFPDNRNIFNFFGCGGFVFKGPLCWRPDDSINFACAYGQFTHTLRQLVRETASMPIADPFFGIPPTYEAILELNYWFQINPWLAIAPDAQYIIRPKGIGIIENAFVVGLQLGVNF